jgi:lysophospholipase L1-like esterase
MLAKFLRALKYIYIYVSIIVIALVIGEIGTSFPRYKKFKKKGNSDLLFYKAPFLEHRLRPFFSRVYENGMVNVNSFGFRGKEFSLIKPDNTFRIICIGESTTFGIGSSSDEFTYPVLLERYLSGRKENSDLKIEVINAGIPSYVSFQCYALLGLELTSLDPDLIIIYTGWNELGASLSSSWNSDYRYGFKYGKFHEQDKNFFQFVGFTEYLKNSYFIKWWKKQAERIREGLHLAKPKDYFPKIDASAEIENTAIRVWENNIRNMIGLAKGRGIRVLLFTWPQLPNISLESYDLGELKAKVPKGLIVLDDNIKKEWNGRYRNYQKKLFDIAKEEGVYLSDIALAFEKIDNSSLFYDDVHLSDAGNRELAERLGSFIIENIDFKQAR